MDILLAIMTIDSIIYSHAKLIVPCYRIQIVRIYMGY